MPDILVEQFVFAIQIWTVLWLCFLLNEVRYQRLLYEHGLKS